MIRGVLKTRDLLKNLLLIVWYYPVRKVLKTVYFMLDDKKHTFLDVFKE